MDSYKKELRKLTDLIAVTGHEENMIQYMFSRFKEYTDNVRVDKIGNVIAFFKGKNKKATSIMIFAHMDEIGLMIKKVSKNGFIFIERLGGINRRVLPGTLVKVQTEKGDINGVIGVKSHHYMNDIEKSTLPQINEIYIDIGLSIDSDIQKLGIEVGNSISYKNCFTEFSDFVIGAKAIDNRVGCLCLLKFAEFLKHNAVFSNVYLVGTVLEEFNLKGAAVAANIIKPDLAIGIDITPSCDTPDLTDKNEVFLGSGPAITMLDFHGRGMLAGLIPDKKWRKFIEKICIDNRIPFQRSVVVGLLTDASYLPTLGEGIISASVSIPVRYSHAPIEVVDIRDIEQTQKLIELVLKNLSESNYFGKSN